jgi:hypothetical protein
MDHMTEIESWREGVSTKTSLRVVSTHQDNHSREILDELLTKPWPINNLLISLENNIRPYQGTYARGRDIHGEEMENSGEDVKFGEVGLCVDGVRLGLVVRKAYRALLEIESLRSHIGCSG